MSKTTHNRRLLNASRRMNLESLVLVTTDVPTIYARAIKAGATSVRAPAMMPWGQTVGYLRDNAGHLVQLCTPLQNNGSRVFRTPVRHAAVIYDTY